MGNGGALSMRSDSPDGEIPGPNVEPEDAVSDPGRRSARAILRRASAAALATVATMAVLSFFGTGGYRNGFALSAVPLVLVAAVGTVWAIKPSVQVTKSWVAVNAVVGLVLAGAVVEVSPPSRGRLSAEADALRLPFHKVIDTRESGNSRCAPCPVVVRRYRAPVPSVEGTISAVLSALMERGLIAGVRDFKRTSAFTEVRGERDGTEVLVTIEVPPGPVREPLITVRLRGRR